MKKLFFALCTIFIMVLTSCSDDKGDKNKLPDIENPSLKELSNLINTNVASIQTLVNAIVEEDSIKTISPISRSSRAEGDVIGYDITFVHTQPTTIYFVSLINENDSVKAPAISVKLDGEEGDQHYYWTVNDGFILDSLDQKVAAKDGVIPQLRYHEEAWEITTDNGKTWEAIEYPNIDSDDYMFDKIDTSDLDFVTFTLSNGTEIVLYRSPDFNVIIDENNLIQMLPNATRSFEYKVTGDTIGLRIELNPSSDNIVATTDDVHAANGTITITTGPSVTENDALTIIVYNRNGRIVRTINIEEMLLNVTDNNAHEVPQEGGTLSVKLETNTIYSVSIPEDAQDWVSLAASRSEMRQDTLTFIIEPNNGEERVATINVLSEKKNHLADITIIQKGDGESNPTIGGGLVGNVPEDMVEAFPNEAFRQYLISYCDLDKSGTLTQEELNTVYEIDLEYNVDMTSLQGIEYCRNLITLVCHGNKLTSLDLSHNPALQFLDCHDCQIEYLNINGCTSLQTLDCGGNNFKSLNVSNFTSLKNLDCAYNGLETLKVKGCFALEQLSCSDNKIKTLDISDCNNLILLWCSYNQLTTLDVSNTKISDKLPPNPNGIVDGEYEERDPLYCRMTTLETLKVKEGSDIPGIIPTRDDKEHIYVKTQIIEVPVKD